MQELDEELAGRLAQMALAGIDREFPHKSGVVLQSRADLADPSTHHPVFYGHFDWHSSVHGHWSLVRLANLFPTSDWIKPVRSALAEKFSKSALAAEAAFLRNQPSFERMYGWAWALRLGRELRATAEFAEYAEWFAPIEKSIFDLATDYLPKLDWPVRCGFHPETSFALGMMLDWAKTTGACDFAKLLGATANRFYLTDENAPIAYEPSGNDFFSPSLNEADLMRRVLCPEEFADWLTRFFPKPDDENSPWLGGLRNPASVSDLNDGHLVHLVGLNLSRAWTMQGIASALPSGDPRTADLTQIANHHAEAGLADTFSGSYEGEHWLGSFAIYLLAG